MNKTIEALKLAEEALVYHTQQTRPIQKTDEALAAIREALAEQSMVMILNDPHPPHRLCECTACLEYWTTLPDCDAFAASGKVIAEPVKQEPVAWINEDELPEYYPYDKMFQSSRIIDGVRMFPNVKMPDRPMFYGLTKDHTWLSVTESQFNKLKPEKRMKCYLTPVDAKAIRAEALEQAAKVCESEAKEFEQAHLWDEEYAVKNCAAAIRELK